MFQTQAVPAAVAAIVLAGRSWPSAWPPPTGARSASALATATDDLAHLLFHEYVLAFEAVSVLLLAAVIGGVFLARREGASRRAGRQPDGHRRAS